KEQNSYLQQLKVKSKGQFQYNLDYRIMNNLLNFFIFLKQIVNTYYNVFVMYFMNQMSSYL
ncbi:MAG: hypothetical protein ACFFD1_08240, partial [Candidatus Thorarchaeota archaeon]